MSLRKDKEILTLLDCWPEQLMELVVFFSTSPFVVHQFLSCPLPHSLFSPIAHPTAPPFPLLMSSFPPETPSGKEKGAVSQRFPMLGFSRNGLQSAWPVSLTSRIVKKCQQPQAGCRWHVLQWRLRTKVHEGMSKQFVFLVFPLCTSFCVFWAPY